MSGKAPTAKRTLHGTRRTARKKREGCLGRPKHEGPERRQEYTRCCLCQEPRHKMAGIQQLGARKGTERGDESPQPRPPSPAPVPPPHPFPRAFDLAGPRGHTPSLMNLLRFQKGKPVGTDGHGNRYYAAPLRPRRGTGAAKERRWVVYAKAKRGLKRGEVPPLPPGWSAWLHHAAARPRRDKRDRRRAPPPLAPGPRAPGGDSRPRSGGLPALAAGATGAAGRARPAPLRAKAPALARPCPNLPLRPLPPIDEPPDDPLHTFS